MKKIPKYLAGYTGECCFLCGRNGTAEPLETHHIFNGTGLRKQSERYGLTVKLCACSCHNGGPNSVHRNQEADRRLKQYGQKKAMEENDWTTEDFIRIFGKNYLDDEDEIPEEIEVVVPEEPVEEKPMGTIARMEAFAMEMARKRRERQGYGQLDLFAEMA